MEQVGCAAVTMAMYPGATSLTPRFLLRKQRPLGDEAPVDMRLVYLCTQVKQKER